MKSWRIRPQVFVMMLTDAVALQLSAVSVFALRCLWSPVEPSLYITVAMLLLSGPFFSSFLGVNQTISLPPHKEVRQLFLSVTLTYLVVLTVLFMTQMALSYSRMVIVGAWGISIIMVPFLRGRVRRALCRKPWWQTPVVFLQQGEDIDSIWRILEEHPRRGLKPVASVAVDQSLPAEPQVASLLQRWPRAIAVCLLEGDSSRQSPFVHDLLRLFPAVLLVPRITLGANRVWLTPRDLEGAVGLMVRQNLMDHRRLWCKRLMDIVLTVAGSLCALPLGLFIAACIKLDSKGPAMYTQERIGEGGRRFRVYKFRTMVPNASEILEQYLASDPALRQEWEREQKLHNDPRVTRVGKWLRKLSLDELPQLLNVLQGTMSIVGPRPIVAGEAERYGRVYKEYVRVRPGITGLWQVSGRNNTTYEERVRMDNYYVTNWSLWMDIWIMVRTVPVVLCGYGAY